MSERNSANKTVIKEQRDGIDSTRVVFKQYHPEGVSISVFALLADITAAVRPADQVE